jgi:hypothetical protein
LWRRCRSGRCLASVRAVGSRGCGLAASNCAVLALLLLCAAGVSEDTSPARAALALLDALASHTARSCPAPLRSPGFKLDRELAALGVTTCAQLRDVPLADLVARFGERVAAMLDGACRGKVRPQASGGAPRPSGAPDPFSRPSLLARLRRLLRAASHPRPLART